MAGAHLHLPSYLRGRSDSELEARVSSLEKWRETLEGYASVTRTYLRRGVIVLMVWALSVLTTALPGSPIAKLAEIVGQLLQAD